MAGPALTGVRNVDNPYDNLQKAVGEAGSIFRDYQNASREAELHNTRMAEVDRVNNQRNFLQNYDPQLGIDGRGLTRDAQRFAQIEEDRIIKETADASRRGETVESPAELAARLRDIRSSLVTQEDAKSLIVNDLLRQGFTAEVANAEADARVANFGSRTAMQAAEEARIRQINENIASDSQRALDYIKASADITRANNTGLGRVGSTSDGSRGAGGNPFSSTGSFSAAEGLENYLRPRIGGWPFDSDTPAATDAFLGGYRSYNQKMIAAGYRPLPISEFEMFVAENIERGNWFDNEAIFENPGEVEAALLRDYGARGYTGSSGGGSGSEFSRERLTIDPQLTNRALNSTQVAPRGMTELEKERVRIAYGRPLPTSTQPSNTSRPAPASSSASASTSTPAGGNADAAPTKAQLEARDRLLEAYRNANIPATIKAPTEDRGIPNPDTVQNQRTSITEPEQVFQDTVNTIDSNIVRINDLRQELKSLDVPWYVENGSVRYHTDTSRQTRKREINEELQALESEAKFITNTLSEHYSPREAARIRRALQRRQADRDAASRREQEENKKVIERSKTIRNIEQRLNSRNLPEPMRRHLTDQLEDLRGY